ncbi:UNVERIFIED_CONTAM: Homeobox protein knotted-1-like LET6 [Sesamum calycinum]|uniref:Homeobox protein knotted-1-like LET6 n=1 Tax=Sesamum calycinum TaxID=2727403 RepID=A0AAW2Q6J6_9LAMI
MESGGGGGSSSSSCFLAFGENNNLFCPIMMMPPMVSSHHPNADSGNNLFLPLPSPNRHGSTGGGAGSSMMLQDQHNNNSNNNTSTGYYFMESSNDAGSCSIGAPPEVVARLEEACASAAAMRPHGTSCVGEDPALDQFMEAYCEMLTKYEQELSKPFKEAMLFLSRIECQFKALTLSPSDSACADAMERNASSEEEVDVNNNSFIDPRAEDRELKAQKLALAEATGLDQKQINNWFINQRKRHWKPSEDMQFVVMDAGHPHYYMDHVLGNPFPMDISPAPALL